MATWVSWIFYAGALFGLSVTIAAAVFFRKALAFFNGHLAIGAGFTTLCACIGYLVEHDPPVPVVVAVIAIGLAGHVLLRWGRRRANDADRFFQAVEAGRAKRQAPPAD
jgi:hypothetical protein